MKRLSLLSLLTIAACGWQIDGDQWHNVVVRNDVGRQVTVVGITIDPGTTTTVSVADDTGADWYRVSDRTGRSLGCLPASHDASLAVTELPPCPGDNK